MDATHKGKCPKCGWKWYKCNNCGAAGCRNEDCENNNFRSGYIAPVKYFVDDVCRVCGK